MVLAALAAVVPASPSAQAAPLREYRLLVNSALTNSGGVQAQGHSFPLLLTFAPSNVTFIDLRTWVDLSGIRVPVWHIQIGTSGECLNALNGGAVFEDSCIPSDRNEQWRQIPTGSKTGGARNFWYINAGNSNASHEYIFLTAETLSTGSLIIGEAAGAGGRAAWNRPCRLNC
jgi:hypothetical protein